MRNVITAVAFLVLAGFVYGQEDVKPKADPNAVDPEAWRAAQEKWQAQQANKGSDLEQLRTENERLRKRVAELEKILGMSFAGAAPHASGHVYTSVADALAACRLPLNPKDYWTDLQTQKAQDTARAALVGEKFQGQMILASATSDKGFVSCTFWREMKSGKTEVAKAKFDARYSDVLSTWKPGVAYYSFEGTINDVVLDKDQDGIEMLPFLTDCTPSTRPPVPIKEPKTPPSSRLLTPGKGRPRG